MCAREAEAQADSCCGLYSATRWGPSVATGVTMHPFRGVAQSGSAPHWGCGGRRFKSGRPDQFEGLGGPALGARRGSGMGKLTVRKSKRRGRASTATATPCTCGSATAVPGSGSRSYRLTASAPNAAWAATRGFRCGKRGSSRSTIAAPFAAAGTPLRTGPSAALCAASLTPRRRPGPSSAKPCRLLRDPLAIVAAQDRRGLAGELGDLRHADDRRQARRRDNGGQRVCHPEADMERQD